jgi:hypothetical protein
VLATGSNSARAAINVPGPLTRITGLSVTNMKLY